MYYLVTVDHYSDFYELDQLKDTLSATVVQDTNLILHDMASLCTVLQTMFHSLCRENTRSSHSRMGSSI